MNSVVLSPGVKELKMLVANIVLDNTLVFSVTCVLYVALRRRRWVVIVPGRRLQVWPRRRPLLTPLT